MCSVHLAPSHQRVQSPSGLLCQQGEGFDDTGGMTNRRWLAEATHTRPTIASPINSATLKPWRANPDNECDNEHCCPGIVAIPAGFIRFRGVVMDGPRGMRAGENGQHRSPWWLTRPVLRGASLCGMKYRDMSGALRSPSNHGAWCDRGRRRRSGLQLTTTSRYPISHVWPSTPFVAKGIGAGIRQKGVLMTVTASRLTVGLLAAAVVALAGCNGDAPSTTPTSTGPVSQSSPTSEPPPVAPSTPASPPLPTDSTTLDSPPPAPPVELTPTTAPQATSPASQPSEPTFLYCENGTAIYSGQAYVVGDPRCPQPTPANDPYGRDYQCDAQGANCTYPDGSPVPGYQRCGTQCGEAPTSGEVQRKWIECIAVKSEEQCRAEQ